jgi:hypothetical protein
MNFQEYRDPWLHYTIPNFLTDEIFETVSNTAKSILDFDTKNHRSMINHKHDEKFTNYFKSLYPTFCKKLEIIEMPEKSVQVAFQYVNYNDYTQDTLIHSDSFAKQFSCLVPISETGSGTLLYDQQLNFVKEVEWYKNTALVFANKPHHMHAIGRSNRTIRCLLNILFMPHGYASMHEKIFKVNRDEMKMQQQNNIISYKND